MSDSPAAADGSSDTDDDDALYVALARIAASAEAITASMISMVRYQEAILEVLMEIRNGQ